MLIIIPIFCVYFGDLARLSVNIWFSDDECHFTLAMPDTLMQGKGKKAFTFLQVQGNWSPLVLK